MVKCTFTGREEHPHKGIHLIKNDGTVEYYSSSKAIKNARKLRRDKRKLKWTEAYHTERQKAKVQVEYKAAEKSREESKKAEK